ncbi:Vicilin-like antimicrobial peptides 2-1 [Acorus calamus]|uniref:Vicilin-like antimicrobial peptides 2-1 n=1 Tax=Acorus calamus TaxID=4465 RepID=A0AAV9EJH5_ACOCL|nr:Vicilin-like antimicrobial peptides 2-1 [Acorus calamus]
MGTKAAKPLLILLVLSLASLAFCYQGEDPQRQLRQCEHQCRQSERGPREQSRCMRECREQYEQQQQQEEEEREQRRRGGESDETRDPREEFQQCQQQCQQQHRHDQRQKGECQRRCEERYREQRRGSRGGEREDDDNETRDPREEFQQCQQQCQQQHRHDQRQMGECQRRCEERYREQQQREQQEERRGERGRGGRYSEESEDPREEFQQCQQQCQQQHRHDQHQMRECQQRCEERYREQREKRSRERGSRGERDREETENDAREEFQQCQQQCQQQHQHDQRRMGECQRRCKERYQEHKEQEKEREARGHEGRERETRGHEGSEETRDPREEYLQCQQQCQQQHGRDRRRLSECQRRCEERYRGEHQQGNRRGEEEQEEREEQEGREGEGERNNPFFYGRESFVHRIRTQHGSVRVLQRFSKRSELLRGIDNYRLAILKANPNTFIIPNHWDAEAVFFVVQGRGTITMLREENRESHNLRVGDIMHVPAGTTTYLINNDNNQKLYIAKILQPISTPGQFETFFGVGGENPESFYKSFSTEVLEAAFNVVFVKHQTRRDKLDRLFGQQRKGAIIRASEEQIRSMSRSTGGRGWPFHGESSKGPYNLFDKRPSLSNEHGQLFEACSEDYQQLRDLNMDVSFINISSGSMLTLNYNSQATKMAMVVGGNGQIEMACPHVSGERGRSQQSQREKEQEQQHEEQEQQQEEEEEEEEEKQEGRRAQRGQRGQRSVHYQRVSARLSPGTAFVVPAGHPIAIVSSGNENLRIVSFGANANNNKRFFLAGRNIIWNQMEREAKELSFGMASREVEEIIGAQRGTGFVEGPKERQRREKGQKALESILDFVGL